MYWTNAKVTPGGLKPFAHLWQNVAAESGNTVQEETFWSVVVQSIRDGYFDNKHRLFLMEESRTRITAAKLREVGRCDDATLLHMISQSFASVSTLTTWAEAYHYSTPELWSHITTQAVSAPAPPLPSNNRAKLQSAVIASLRRLSLPSTASQTETLDAVNRDLKSRGEHTTSLGTLKSAQAEVKRLK